MAREGARCVVRDLYAWRVRHDAARYVHAHAPARATEANSPLRLAGGGALRKYSAVQCRAA